MAAIPAVVVGLLLTAITLRSMLLLGSSSATPARQRNPHSIAARQALVGQRCERCNAAGIRADGVDCVSCDATGIALLPRNYLGRIWNSGGAAVSPPVASPALIPGGIS